MPALTILNGIGPYRPAGDVTASRIENAQGDHDVREVVRPYGRIEVSVVHSQSGAHRDGAGGADVEGLVFVFHYFACAFPTLGRPWA